MPFANPLARKALRLAPLHRQREAEGENRKGYDEIENQNDALLIDTGVNDRLIVVNPAVAVGHSNEQKTEESSCPVSDRG